MDKIGHRAVIQYLHIKGLTPKEIHEDMVATLRDNAPSYSIVRKWTPDFKWGRDSLEDDPCQGKTATVPSQENFFIIHDMLLTDWPLTFYYERFVHLPRMCSRNYPQPS